MHSYSSLLGAALLLCVLIPFAQNNNTISCNLRLLLRQNLVFQFMRKEKILLGFVTWKQVVYTLNIHDIDSRLSESINCDLE